jgi:hypothetical protein
MQKQTLEWQYVDVTFIAQLLGAVRSGFAM